MRILTTLILLAFAAILTGDAEAQRPPDRMRPVWKIDSSALRSHHVLTIWALDDTTSNFDNDPDSNVISIVKSAKSKQHKLNSGISKFEIDSRSSIFDPAKFKISFKPSFEDYTIQDTLVISIEMIDTAATAMFNLNMQDSAGNGFSRFIYLQPTSNGPSVLSTHPLLRYNDLISPYWRLDTSELRSHHRFEIVAIDDTLLRENDTTQIAKAIRWQLDQSRTSHRGNSGLMELYPVQYYLGYDTSAFRITLSSWDGYTVRDSMRMAFEWVDTTSSGFFKVMIADSSGQGIGTEAYFFITPNASSTVPISAEHDTHTAIYPNPASDLIWINSDQELNVSITSTDGRVLEQRTARSFLDVSALTAGRYFLIIGQDVHSLTIIR